MSEFKPSSYQQALFDWVQTKKTESAIVEAVAGSGKTTTLLHAIQYMNGTVFLGMFNKKICDEIKEKVTTLPENPNVRLNISTLHAAGLSALTSAIGRMVVDNYKSQKLFNLAIEYGKLDIEDSAIETSVTKLVSFAKQHALDIDEESPITMWEHLIEHYSIVDFGDKAKLIRAAKLILEYSNQGTIKTKTIDFDDMLYEPIKKNVPFKKYDWVLIDEAQDTNFVRREIALRMMHKKSRLIAIGDRHQAIYGFTGADSNSLDLIAESTKAKSFPLHVSYRCPKKVVVEAQKYVGHIQAFENAIDGDVATIEHYDLHKHTKIGDAILCRFNAPLVKLIYQFLAKGIPAVIEGREIGNGIKTLVRKLKAKTFDELLNKLEDFKQKETERFIARKEQDKIQTMVDKVDCATIIINRVINKKLPDTIIPAEAVCTELDLIFGDKLDKSKVIVLCSIHKSKGLEWHNVYLLLTGPSSYAKLPWEHEQENNLMYVAVTRAQKKLVYVTQPSKEQLELKA